MKIYDKNKFDVLDLISLTLVIPSIFFWAKLNVEYQKVLPLCIILSIATVIGIVWWCFGRLWLR